MLLTKICLTLMVLAGIPYIVARSCKKEDWAPYVGIPSGLVLLASGLTLILHEIWTL